MHYSTLCKLRTKSKKIEEKIEADILIEKLISVKNNGTEAILNTFGIETQKLNSGKLSISHYSAFPKEKGIYGNPPYQNYFQEAGIDENILFEDIEIIEGNADFRFSNLENLISLKEIGKSADFTYSKIKSLGSLEKIGGCANFTASNVEYLGDLKEILGTPNFYNSKIKSLGNLKTIHSNGTVDFHQLVSLGKLEKIRAVKINFSNVQDLGNLNEVYGIVSPPYINSRGAHIVNENLKNKLKQVIEYDPGKSYIQTF